MKRNKNKQIIRNILIKLLISNITVTWLNICVSAIKYVGACVNFIVIGAHYEVR